MKSLKEISETLRLAAQHYPEGCPEDSDKQNYAPEELAVFTFDTLTIRCKPLRESVLRVADKYAKGIGRIHKQEKFGPRTTPRRAFSTKAWQDFLDDQAFPKSGHASIAGRGFDNALEYCRLFPFDKLPKTVQQWMINPQERAA